MTSRLPLLLALDTATEMCSVALAREGVVDEMSEHAGQKHSERILPMIDELLARHGIALADCDAIAFGAGPGSFTGLRIACGIAQGLAWGADKRVLPVSNLAALALRGADHLAAMLTAASPVASTAASIETSIAAPAAASHLIAVAIDARLGECYWALFESSAGRLRQIDAPALTGADDLAALLALHDIDLLVGNAIPAFPQLRGVAPNVLTIGAAGAAALARLAEIDWLAGRAVRAAEAVPVYVRERVALTIEERRAIAAAASSHATPQGERMIAADAGVLASAAPVISVRGAP